MRWLGFDCVRLNKVHSVCTYICACLSCLLTDNGGEEGGGGGSSGEFLELGLLLQVLNGGKERFHGWWWCSQCVPAGREDRGGGGKRDVVADCRGLLGAAWR